MDASSLLAEVGVSPEDLAKAIRADIEEKTRCCASVGMGESPVFFLFPPVFLKIKTTFVWKSFRRIAPFCSGSNILLARLATRKGKPNGQFLLRSEDVDDFIRDLPVTSLPGGYTSLHAALLQSQKGFWNDHVAKLFSLKKKNYSLYFPGVGHVMAKKLATMGVKSCADLQQVALSQLQKKFGPRTGQTLFRFCRGLDDRPVRFEKERKSVSADMNYNIRFTTVRPARFILSHVRPKGAGFLILSP